MIAIFDNNKAHTLYPFLAQSILPNLLVKDIKLNVPANISQVYITSVIMRPNYIFISLQGVSINGSSLTGYFQLNNQMTTHFISSNQKQVIGFIYLNKLPDSFKQSNYSLGQLQLNPVCITRYSQLVPQIVSYNTTGLISIQQCSSNSLKVYRNINPGQQLNTNVQHNNKNLQVQQQFNTIKVINDIGIRETLRLQSLSQHIVLSASAFSDAGEDSSGTSNGPYSFITIYIKGDETFACSTDANDSDSTETGDSASSDYK